MIPPHLLPTVATSAALGAAPKRAGMRGISASDRRHRKRRRKAGAKGSSHIRRTSVRSAAYAAHCMVTLSRHTHAGDAYETSHTGTAAASPLWRRGGHNATTPRTTAVRARSHTTPTPRRLRLHRARVDGARARSGVAPGQHRALARHKALRAVSKTGRSSDVLPC